MLVERSIQFETLFPASRVRAGALCGSLLGGVLPVGDIEKRILRAPDNCTVRGDVK